MLGFQIQHVKKEGSANLAFESNSSPTLLFETCLRKIWISPENSPAIEGLPVLSDEDAYAFLLEVISGLHSPIFGETEILGQFKNFLEAQKADPHFAFFQSWSRLLLEDVKFLRSTYFRGQGQHSYGSLLRKKLQAGQELWILGAGQLTESMLPWLTEQAVTLWARDTQKVSRRFPSARVQPLMAAPPTDAILMVAAPLTDAELAPYLAANPDWIDLREKNISSELPKPRISLLDLYKESASNQEQKTELKKAVLSRIQAMSVERMNRAWFRPQGWEDTCAS